MEPSDPNYYSILGVDSNASQEEIEAAYRRWRDEYKGGMVPTPEEAEWLSQIDAAHYALSDPERRSEYDATHDPWDIVRSGSDQVSARFCQNCGNRLAPGGRFCEQCGIAVGLRSRFEARQGTNRDVRRRQGLAPEQRSVVFRSPMG